MAEKLTTDLPGRNALNQRAIDKPEPSARGIGMVDWLVNGAFLLLAAFIVWLVFSAAVAFRKVDRKVWSDPMICSQRLRKCQHVALSVFVLLSMAASIPSLNTPWWFRIVGVIGFACWMSGEVVWALLCLNASTAKLPSVVLYAKRVCWSAAAFVTLVLWAVVFFLGGT